MHTEIAIILALTLACGLGAAGIAFVPVPNAPGNRQMLNSMFQALLFGFGTGLTTLLFILTRGF